MRLDLVFPTLPPAIDGIADHTRLLAATLAKEGHLVRVLTRAVAQQLQPSRAIPGVEIVDVWQEGELRLSATPVLRAVRGGRPDAVVLQFEQFTYGPRGFNPRFASLFLRVARAAPEVTRVLFAHETYPTADTPRLALMWAYQRPQFHLLTRAADVVLVSTDAWLPRLRGRRARVAVSPVFSNVPVLVGADRAACRAGLGIPPDRIVGIWFGQINGGRGEYFAAAARVLRDDPRAVLVYAGTDAAAARRLADQDGDDLRVVKRPDGQEISALLQAADIAISPFPDGVTTRRGSFLAFLQHGLPTVTTIGPQAGALLEQAAADGVFVASPVGRTDVFAELLQDQLRADDRVERGERMRRAAEAFYNDHFAPERAAHQLLELVSSSIQKREGATRNSS